MFVPLPPILPACRRWLCLIVLAWATWPAPAAAPVITNAPTDQTVFLGDAATFTVGAGGTPALAYQWFRNGAAVNGASASRLSFPTSAADHRAQFSVRVTNTTGAVTSAPATLTVDFGVPGPTQTNRLLEVTDLWRYDVRKTDLGTAWTAFSYDDSAWPAGGGLLYLEDAALPAPTTTALPLVAGALPATCYFRARFTNTLANAYAVSLVANAVIDDGLVLHLNGAEVLRLGLPEGAVTYSTWANRSVGNAAWEGPFELSAATLLSGTNVLAAEVHQINAGSSDIVMGLTLDAVWQPRLRDTVAPTVASVLPAPNATVATLGQVEVLFSEAVQGVDAADLRLNGVAATNVTVVGPDAYVFYFAPPPTGVVTVSWAPAHGITDRSANANPFTATGWNYFLDPRAFATRVRITEFMAANSRTLRDDDGDYSDWIELFNSGADAVNLAGWSLTDEATKPAKWKFPAITLLPQSYLLVWASAKNRTNAATPLHTSFKLAKAGQYLGLVFSDGVTVASEFAPAFPPQEDDISYGRDRLDPSLMGYFLTPTPGAANGSFGAGFGPAVQFSVTSRPFLSAFNLALTQPDTNFVLRYFLVTNAASAALTNVPTATSPLYTGPLQINATTQVRARTFPKNAGWFPGPPRSESFVQMGSAAWNFSSSVPLVLIHTFGAGGIPATVDQNAVVMVFGTNWGRASFANPPDVAFRSGINRRGSSTQDMPKPSLAVEIWDEFNASLKLPVLDLPAESDWVLYAPNAFDSALIHNPLAYGLSRAVGRYASRTRHAEVFLNTDGGAVNYAAPAGGHYGGLYVLEEKIKRGPDRVDLTKLPPEATTAPEVTGGYLLKIDRADADERTFNTAYGQNIVYQDPKGAEMQLPTRAAQANYLQSYFNSFEAALYGASSTNPVTGYAAWIDRDAWIDHHLINAFTFNVDALRLSGYFFKERERKLAMGPVWDFDRSLGCSGNGDVRAWNPRVWRVQAGGDQGTDMFGNPSLSGVRWWQALFNDPDFWQRWIDRWQELRRGPYATTNLNALVDALTTPIREAQSREFYRWAETRPRTGTVSANGYTFTFPGDYAGEITFLKQWLLDRTTFLDTNFLRAPSLSSPGGPIASGFTLALTAGTLEPNSVIYFTLDDSDPRLPGGGIAPTAIARTNAGLLTLTNNARVFARNRNPLHANVTNYPGSVGGNPPRSSPWSGPTVASFYTTVPPLRLTEIMYHPPAPPAGNTNDADQFEYLEFLNASAAPLNLANFRLSGGVSFTFPSLALAAGQRVLVVKNLAACQSRYGSNLLVAGVFTNQLANGSDRLVLTGPLGEPIHDFTYRDDWYPVTDGAGFALAIRDASLPLADWGLPASWRPSGPGGTPGVADPARPSIAPIVVNEVLTHTDPPQVDSIELFNPTSTNVPVGGWFLTDNLQKPMKYRLPAGTTIAAGGFLVVTTNQFGAGASGFALSALGEEVWLSSGDAQTNLTGYAHGFTYDAAPNGVSFGRHVDSLGREHFPLQKALTLGATNAGPRAGPVAISEIMYHPAATSEALGEYVELSNLATTNAPLYDPTAPTNTFRLRGGVDFDFPPGVVLAPGEALLVVGFPTNELSRLSDFRTRYGVPAGVRIFGPWSGRLNNAGETVRLRCPDWPNVAGAVVTVPYWIAEEVTYAPTAPWPTDADGLGYSLQRARLADFADDPANWYASGSTPGRANAPNAAPLVALTDPIPGATVYREPYLPVQATASDADGFVQRVEFWDGDARLITLTSAPYLFTWLAAAPGPHLLRAIAVDNLGASSTSAPVAITVVAGLDTDRDGMPDDWELANGTNPNVRDADVDLDGDGHTNGQEFIAGTSPTNAASVLRLNASLTAVGQPVLSFQAISNRNYSLLGTPALGTAWESLQRVPAVPTNRLVLFTNLPPGSRFLRLVIP